MALLDVEFLEPEAPNRKLSRKERRTKLKNNNNNIKPININLTLKDIKPLTFNQRKTFEYFNEGKNLLLHGYSGTGKTFLALYLALREVMSSNQYKKIVIVRSAVQSRDVGFMPGNYKEKIKQFEDPYIQICKELFGRGDAYTILSNKGIVEFTTTSFLRGITFNDCIVIIDECQNNNFGELNTIITRMGDNSKVIISGDYRQNDLTKKYDESGLPDFMKIINKMKSFSRVEFEINDIVRSGTVREYIIAKEQLCL